MRISSFSWHALVYKWWLNKKPGWSHPRSHNLCLYVRAVLIWAPSRWLFWNGKIGSVHVAIFAWAAMLMAPFYLFNNWETWLAVGVLYALFAMGLLIGSLILFLMDRPRTIKEATATSFFSVLAAYVRAGHEKICPFIEFR